METKTSRGKGEIKKWKNVLNAKKEPIKVKQSEFMKDEMSFFVLNVQKGSLCNAA